MSVPAANPPVRSTVLDRLLEGLNGRQREAVLHQEGPLLILAGAGSGKTRVLTHRIAYLIGQGVPPPRILAITFTNRAAAEMAARVERLLRESSAPLPWLSTFHSACLRMLRPNASLLGLTPTFTIYDQGDSRRVIRRILEALGQDPKRVGEGQVQALISRAKNNLLARPDSFAQWEEGPLGELLGEVYARYETALRSSNAVDFDDLLVLTVQLFEHHPAVREAYSRRFLHVLVDEYQDTNPAQYRLLELLIGSRPTQRNLAVVGDDAQSIYGFRGADLRNILHFERDFPEAKVVKLEQNYRSSQRILDAANALITNNREGLPKRLWSELGEGEPLRCLGLADEREEAAFLAQEVDRLIGAGVAPSQIAVFYRTHALSRLLEEALLGAGLPYRLIGAARFFERAEVKDLLAYLRLLVNPRDTVSFRRAVQAPRRGIGEGTVDRLQELAGREGADLPSLASQAAALGWLRKSSAGALERFADLLNRLRQLVARGISVAALIEEVRGASGLAEALLAAGPEGEGRLENLDQLVALAREREGNGAGSRLTLEEFLQQASLSEGEEGSPIAADAITLTTLHNAKGSEFPVVFIIGCEEGLIPHSQGQEGAKLEEERRLFYVGLTRAMRLLYLTYAETRFLHGRRTYTLPSRFLGELPAKLMVDPRWADQPCGSDFSLGERVAHDLFGSGVVKAVRGEGEVVVHFDDGNERTLLLDYAKLRRL